MKVVSYFHLHEVRWAIPESDLAGFAHRFPSVRFASCRTIEELEKEIPDADVFFGWLFPPSVFGAAVALRWFHTASAGVEANLFPELVASDVTLTNAAGLHSVSIPEHVLALMLALARNLHESQRLQMQARWDRFAAIAFGVGVRELASSNLAIIGAGAIGTALCRLGAALDMQVRVMRRRADQPVEGAEAVVGPDGLKALLAWADFVVLAAPLTAETRHLIDREALAAMKRTAFLINVARGETIDDEALIEALRQQQIAGAGLDVASEEPLSASSPYWALPNVILTPHVSGYTATYFERTLALFADNLERFLRGDVMRNVVNKQLGYVER
jgi:phosphoglycerate dehydrogenase-like enzyme